MVLQPKIWTWVLLIATGNIIHCSGIFITQLRTIIHYVMVLTQYSQIDILYEEEIYYYECILGDVV